MMSNLVGQTLGRHHITDRLGQGKDAVVYKAQQLNLDRAVALKVVPAANAEAVERLRRESQLLAKLQHPGIRGVYGIETASPQSAGAAPGRSAPGYVFAVLEYAEQSLKSLMLERQRSQRPFTLRETTAILRPIAEVLDYLAEHGLSHMDVKPENILLTASGRIMLSDFGVTQAFGRPMSHGTPAYVAPEVIDGRAIGPTTDVYSLAVVAFEMLSGELPFKGENPTALYYAHTHTIPPQLDRVNRSCKNTEAWVIGQALAKTPTARYVSATAFINALERARTLSVRITTFPKRQPRLAFVSALSALVVLIGAPFGVSRLVTPPAPPPVVVEVTATPTVTTEVAPATATPLAATESAGPPAIRPNTPTVELAGPATATVAPVATDAPDTPAVSPSPAVVRSPTPPPDRPQCDFGNALERVALYSPRPGETVKRGSVPLRGIADFAESGQAQVRYEVRVSAGTNADVGQNTIIEQPGRRQGSLGVWNTTNLPAGLYTLQLRAVLNDGNYRICNVLVTLE